MKEKYYSSSKELEMAIVKLKSMDEEAATMLFGSIKDKTPPQSLLCKQQRGLSYSDVSLSSLEYLWFGAKSSSMKNRICAKASYLCRANEHNHPRKKMLFNYSENIWVVKEEETKMILEVYKLGSSSQKDPAKQNKNW
jgi:hypothetical protein